MSIQRRLNADATSWRCIDVETTLYKRHVPAGWCVRFTLGGMRILIAPLATMLRIKKSLTCYNSWSQIRSGFRGVIATSVSNRSWDFSVLFTTLKTHDTARRVTSQKLLLFSVKTWNDRPTLFL